MNIKLALAAVATVMAGPAFGITVNLSDFAYGPVIDVNVTGNQTYSGHAGEYDGSLGGEPNDGARFVPRSIGGVPFKPYSAELGQSVAFGVDYQYDVGTPLTYFGAQKATDLSRLFTAAAGFVTDNSTSGAMQAAIWEIIYENGTSYDLTNGALKVFPANGGDIGSFNAINRILAGLGNVTPAVQIGVLQNAVNQDLIYAAIPEPGTWALLAAGLGAVGLVSRRRKV